MSVIPKIDGNNSFNLTSSINSVQSSSTTYAFDIDSYRSPTTYLSLTSANNSNSHFIEPTSVFGNYTEQGPDTPTFLQKSSSTDYLLYDFNSHNDNSNLGNKNMNSNNQSPPSSNVYNGSVSSSSFNNNTNNSSQTSASNKIGNNFQNLSISRQISATSTNSTGSSSNLILDHAYNAEFLKKLNSEEIVLKDNKSKRASRKRNRETILPELLKTNKNEIKNEGGRQSNHENETCHNTLINCIGGNNSVFSPSPISPIQILPETSSNNLIISTISTTSNSKTTTALENPLNKQNSENSSKVNLNSSSSSSANLSEDFTPIKQTFEKFINFLKDKRWTIAFAAYIFDYSATRMGEILKFRNIKSGKRMLPLWRKLVSNMILIMEDQALQKRLDQISRNFSSKKRIVENSNNSGTSGSNTASFKKVYYVL